MLGVGGIQDISVISVKVNNWEITILFQVNPANEIPDKSAYLKVNIAIQQSCSLIHNITQILMEQLP